MEQELIWLRDNANNKRHMYLWLNTIEHLPDSLDGTRCLNSENLQPELLRICNNEAFHKHYAKPRLDAWLRRFYGDEIPLEVFTEFPKHLQWRLTPQESDDSKSEKYLNKS